MGVATGTAPPGLCAVCGRHARGYGWQPPGRRRLPPLLDRQRRALCSMGCLDLYAHLMRTHGVDVIRTTENEHAAMAAALRPLGDFVAARGLQTPLADYARDDVLALIQTVVTAYHDHLRNAAALQLHNDRRRLHPEEEPFIDDELPF